MTAHDLAAWTDFANTVAGGAAALAGLLFVGLSLNLSEVLKYPRVPARAAATLRLTIAIGGGLNWMTASVATGFASATANAWVLLADQTLTAGHRYR